MDQNMYETTINNIPISLATKILLETGMDVEIFKALIHEAVALIKESKVDSYITNLKKANVNEVYDLLLSSLENMPPRLPISFCTKCINKQEEIIELVLKVFSSKDSSKESEIVAAVNKFTSYYTKSSLTPNIINEKLGSNESIIYQLEDIDFEITNKSLSITGAKSLYFSNTGRVFAYDSGGIVTGESAIISTKPISITMNKENVIVESTHGDVFKYRNKMSIHEFIELYNELNPKVLKIHNLCSYILDGKSSYYCGNIQLNETEIKFTYTNYIKSIKYSHITDFKYNNHILTLKGCFISIADKKIIEELSLFYPSDEYVNELKGLIKPHINNNLDFSKIKGQYSLFTGELNNKYYFNEDVIVSLHKDLVIIISYDLAQPIGAFKLNSMKYYINSNKIFFINNDVIVTLDGFEELNNKLKTNNVEKVEDDLMIGQTPEGHPFIIVFSNNVLILKQSSNRHINSILTTNILDITLKGFSNEDSNLATVSINMIAGSELDINIIESHVPLLIKKTYKTSKIKILESANTPQLFTSWSRHLNDTLNYFYFSSMYCARSELDKVTKKGFLNLDDEDKAMIANILYYVAIEQKKQLDVISIYIPKIIEQQELLIMNNLNKSIDTTAFRILQKQLLAIGGQIKSSLNEIERSLSHIPYILHPQIDSRKALSDSRYSKFGQLALRGVSSLMFGSVMAFPLLAVAGFGFWKTYKLNKTLEEIEKKKVELYVYQALDSFEHLMNYMMPYYISEANEVLFNMCSNISKNYRSMLDLKEVKKELFERISDLYTFKQLPIGDTNIRTKKDIIEEIHRSANLSTLKDINPLYIIGGENYV
ncbi:hypothetical protein GND98_019500 [Clostridium butyricum]|uniref:Uncharacterized protein n=1 Tax=Clostridium butyricum TaxID=1492 RepID=A0A6L9EU81_CLOBU|nr:hypothetical protein [Clostridium butyricum]